MRKERGIATTRLAAVFAHKDAINRLCLSHQTSAFVISLDGFRCAVRELGAVGRCGLDARSTRAQVSAAVYILRRAAGVEPAYVGALACIAHKERDAVAHHVLVDQIQHGGIDHFAQDGVGLLVGITLREHLPCGSRGRLRAISLDIGDGCRFAPEGVVDEIFGIDAEFVVEQVLVECGDAHQVVDAVFLETGRHAGADAPDVGDGAMGPDFLAKGPVVEYADAAGYVLGGNVERYLGLE